MRILSGKLIFEESMKRVCGIIQKGFPFEKRRGWDYTSQAEIPTIPVFGELIRSVEISMLTMLFSHPLGLVCLNSNLHIIRANSI